MKIKIDTERTNRNIQIKRFMSWVYRVAAVLTIGVFCSFFFNNSGFSGRLNSVAYNESDSEIEMLINRQSTKFVTIVKNVAQRFYNQKLLNYQNELTEAKYKSLMRDLYVYNKQDRVGGGVQLENFSLAGYGNVSNIDAAGMLFTELKNEEPIMINPQVRHVWIGNDFESMNEYFENARLAASMDEVIETSSSENGFKFQIVTSKAKLVEFVRNLNHQGFETAFISVSSAGAENIFRQRTGQSCL